MKTEANSSMEWANNIAIMGLDFDAKSLALLIFGMILAWIGIACVVSGIVMIIEAVTVDVPFKATKYHIESSTEN